MKLTIQKKILLSFILIILCSLLIFTFVVNRNIQTHFTQFCKSEYCGLEPVRQGRMNDRQGMKLNENQSSFIDSVQKTLLWTSIGTIIAGFLISLFLSKKITNPICQMIQTTREIAKGNYQKKVIAHSKDEIGALGVALNEMAEKLEKVEQLRTELITNFSHEMVTPLTTINGYLEAIQDGMIETEESKKLTYNILLEETNRLTKMIKDLRELSKIESGRFVIELAPIRAEKVIQKVILSLKLQFLDKEIKSIVNFPSNFPMVLADEDRFQQIFLNLLTNAIRYSPKGSLVVIEGKIKSTTEIEISVKDSGSGIKQKDLPHIFERFYKADFSRSSKNSGSGIGLSIVKDLVALHKGKISVESTDGFGTIFYIIFPIS